MNQPNGGYHHGHLRNALILAAAALIEEQGSLSFSITDAAKRAGVSSAAPYRHFQDKNDLLDNVRDLAFIGLHQALEETQKIYRSSSDTIAAVSAMSLTYLNYAREKRAFFSLMWEDHGQMHPERQNLAHKSVGFSLLLASVEKHLVPSSRKSLSSADQKQALRVATQLWALAHGVATLESNQLLDLFDESAQAEAILIEAGTALLTNIASGNRECLQAEG
ncbi:MAG: TetR/AcrR family transcriptional regulator [Luminiphilus sp.]|nr:TetR/AcrR family transcriptional regulator [Luminiphilus sp.]